MLKITQNNSKADQPADNNEDTLLPLRLTHIPGVIEEQTAYTESIARYPNRRTAFIGALSMMAFAAGRRFRTADNTRTNEYFVCYANSGSGKDAPRKVNKEICAECGCAGNIGDSVGSGEGIQDVLLTKAKYLLQNDEFDTLVRTIAEDKSGAKESMVRELLTEYSSSGSMINRRALSSSFARQAKNTKDCCIHPHFCFFGSCVGQYLFEALNDRALENGIVARCVMVDCGKRQPRQIARYREVPEGIVNAYRNIMQSKKKEDGSWFISDAPDVKREMFEIHYTEDAMLLSEETMNRYDDEYDKLNDGQHAAEQSFLARTGEHMTKMAMLYALSVNPEDPIITVDAVKWADEFVTHCQRAMISNIERFTSANPHEANVKRIRRMMGKRKIITLREITKCLRLPVAVARETVEYMITVGDLRELEKDSGVFHAAK